MNNNESNLEPNSVPEIFDEEITTLSPEDLEFIHSLGDDPECHSRVPICFGGDFDPDA